MALLSQSPKILVYTSDLSGRVDSLQPWSTYMPQRYISMDRALPAGVVVPNADFTKVAWQGTGAGYLVIKDNTEYAPPTRLYGGVADFTLATSNYRQIGALTVYSATTSERRGGVRFTQPSPHPSGWNMLLGGTPTTFSRFHPSGGWSADETAFVSLVYHEDDQCLYLSVDTEQGTVVPRKALDIGEPFRFIDTRMEVIYRSPTDIVILYLRHTGSIYEAKHLYAIEYTGGTVCTQRRLGTLLLSDIVMCRHGDTTFLNTLDDNSVGTAPCMQRMFRLNTATLTLTQVHVQDAQQTYPGQYLPTAHGVSAQGNHSLVYKGYCYYLVARTSGLWLYRHPVGAPDALTLFVARWFPNVDTANATTAARNAGIEYDPVSDTAYLTYIEVELAGAYDWADVAEVRLFAHTVPLDSTGAWSPRVRVANHAAHQTMSQLNGATAQDLRYWRSTYTIAYLPSRHGVSAMSTVFLYAEWNPSRTDYAYIHTIRFHLWTEPGVAELALAFDIETHVEDGVRVDYGLGLPFTPEVGMELTVVRRREIAWPTRWGSVADTGVSLEINWPIQPDVVIDVTEALPIDLALDWSIGVGVEIDVTADKVVTFDHLWFSVGETFLQDFTDILNADRSASYGLPPLKLAGTDAYSLEALRTTDIAQRHSENMARTRVHAHEGEEFPQGWQLIPQRLAWLSNDGFGSENIQTQSAAYTYGTPLPTALEVWTTWRNSPPHYENMTTDWHALAGVDNAANLYSALGCQWGLFPVRDDFSTIEDTPQYLTTIYSTNVFVIIKEQKVDTQFFHQWESAALQARTLDFQWSSASLAHVAREFSAVYDAPLQIEHVAPTSSTVSAQHVAAFGYGVAAQHSATYAGTVKLREINFNSRYDLLPNLVTASHQAVWSRSLGRQHTALYDNMHTARSQIVTPYASLPKVSRQLVSLYAGLPTVRASHMTMYWPTKAVGRTHTSIHALLHGTGRWHTAQLGLGAFVNARHAAAWDIRTLNSVAAQHAAGYDLQSSDAPLVMKSPVVTAYLNGRALDVTDGVISGDFEASGFSFETKVDDLTFVRGAKLCDPIDVDVDGTVYHMFLSNISGDDAQGSAASEVRIEAKSPVYLLDAPYASNTTYAPETEMMFSDIVQQGLGAPVDFSRHIDWSIPYGRVAGGSQTPLAFARALLQEVGSRLLSNPDGTLYVLPRFPHPFNALPVGIPEHALDVAADVVTRSSTHEYKKGLNRFRVRDAEEEFGDLIEFDHETSIASVWVSPYRTNWSLRCTTTPGITLDPMGEDVYEFEQVLDIKAGSASVTYPILALVSVEWVTDNLGGLSVEEGSTAVTAPITVNHGYGLARVKYTSRRSRFLLESSSPIEATQLIVVEH